MATQLRNLNQSAHSTTVTLPNVMIYGAEWVWTIFTHSSSWVFSASTLAPLTLQSGAAAPSTLQEQSCTSFTTARAELQLLYHCKNWTAVTSLLQELFHSYFTAARTELQLLHCCKNGTAVTSLLQERNCSYCTTERADKILYLHPCRIWTKMQKKRGTSAKPRLYSHLEHDQRSKHPIVNKV